MSSGLNRLKEFHGDLHIHTCLSPCADLEMSPRSIVKKAREKGLHFIGICDHNSAENVGAAKKVGSKENVEVIGGMEVTSSEEVHVLALFDMVSRLHTLQQVVYRNLRGTNDVRLYGDQVVVNEEDEVIRFNRKLLIGAAEMTIREVVDLIHRLKGVAIASHVDRQGFGIIGQLGFVPEDLDLDALEISDRSRAGSVSVGREFPIVVSSDAHFLEDVGRERTSFFVEKVTVEELKKSFRGADGRRIIT
jgi:3',5'-nucleoside bisphosphate phosphatase